MQASPASQPSALVDADTTAMTADDSHLHSTGAVTVTAGHNMGVQAIAASAGFSGGAAVGAALAINIVGKGTGGSNTTASIGDPTTSGSGATVDASGAVTVQATHSLVEVPTLTLPASIVAKIGSPSVALTSLAVSAGGSSGSAGIAGSAGINIFNTTTTARIDDGATLNVGSLDLEATDTTHITSAAGSIGVSTNGAGIGAGLDVGVITKHTQAIIGVASVMAGGNITVHATGNETIVSVSANAGIGGSTVGIAGSASVEFLDTHTFATVADGTGSGLGLHATLNAGGDVSVHAETHFDLKGIAGSLGVGSSAGVGAANETLVHHDEVQAVIGNYAQVTSNGGNGVTVNAESTEQIIGITVAGGFASTAGVSGSAAVNAILDENTTARVGAGAQVTTTAGSLIVNASDDTTMVTIAGSLAASGTASVGVGVDVASIGKTTKAYIDSGVTTHISGNIEVTASATEDITSVAVGLAASGTAAVTADASVHVINNTTLAFIGAETGTGIGHGDVNADGSVLISANDGTELNKVVGAAAFSGTAAVTAAGAVTVSNKTTEAFIGQGAWVTGRGNSSVMAPTGAYDLNATSSGPAQQYDNTPGANNSNASGIEAQGSENSSIGDLKAKGAVKPPTPVGSGGGGSSVTGQPTVSSADLTQTVHKTPIALPASGVIVAATSNDDVNTYSIGLAGAGSAAIAVAASVNVINPTTTATIGANAHVNDPSVQPGATPNGSQQVIVLASNDFRHVAAAAGLAVSGGASVAPAVDVTVTDAHTSASIAGGSVVHASDDVQVIGKASEDILLVGIGIAGGIVGIGGGVNVLSLTGHTDASISGKVRAGGDALVHATDDTKILLVDGGLGVGYVGIGAGVGVVVIDKHTSALIGVGADVTALGNGTGDTVNDGDTTGGVFGMTVAHGVIVDASSSEDLFHLAIAGGGGFVGAAGSVTVDLISSETKAIVGAADVNWNDNGFANPDQNAFVTASNHAKVQTFVLSVAGGVVGIGGAVDVGSLNNNTTADVQSGARVAAAGDVQVDAAAIKEVDSLTISGAGGIAGLAGTVSIWTIGETLSAKFTDSSGTSGNALDRNKKANQGDADNNVSVADDAQTQSKGTRDQGVGTTSTISSNQPGPTGSRISDATSAVNADLGSSNIGGASALDIATKIGAAPPVIGTSALIEGTAQIKAGAALDVIASESLTVNVNSGSVGVGVAGIAASVSVLNVATNVTASATGTLSAGAALNVKSGMDETLDVHVLAFGGGLVGLGAAVSVINDSSTNNATLGGTVLSAGDVSVKATSMQHLPTTVGEGSVGAGAVGVTWVDVEVTGTDGASIANGAQIGQSGNVASLTVAADSTVDAPTTVIGVSGGAIAATFNFDKVKIHPTVSAGVGDNANITTNGAIEVTADTHQSASGNVIGVAISGLGSAALSSTDVEVTPTVTTTIGKSSVKSKTAGVNFRARHNSGPTDGGLLVEADATAASGSVGIAAAGALAQGTNSAVVSATAATGSSVAAAGASGFEARNVGVVHGNSSGGSGSLLGSAAFMNAKMFSQGSASVSFSGSVTDSGSTPSDFALTANATRTAKSQDFVLSLAAGISASDASAESTASGDTTATFTGSSSVDIGGAMSADAASTNLATAKTTGGGGAILGSGVFLDASTTVGGTTSSTLDAGATVTGAGSVAITSEGSSTSSSDAIAGSGGLITGEGVKSETNVTPTVSAAINSNANLSGVGGFVHVIADLKQSEGDASAAAYGGGVVRIGAASATGTVNPTVTATIGSGTHITAGGDVSVEATSEYTPPAQPFGDTFNAGTTGVDPTDYTADVITFRQHGLATGDTVVYHNNGGSVSTFGGGTLQDGRTYGVIAPTSDTLNLGAQFKSSNISDAVGLLLKPGDAGVDPTRDMIRFASPHNFANGDPVRYDDGSNPTIGLTQGTTYFVHVVDPYTIKLFANQSDALVGDTGFDTSEVASDKISLTNYADGSPISNGDRITYRDQTPLAFRASDVDTASALFTHLPTGGYTDNDTIFAGVLHSDGTVDPTNLNTDDQVIYHTDNPASHIGALTDGGVYYVERVPIGGGLFDPYRIQLSNSKGGAALDVTGTNSTDQTLDANKVQHWLTRPSLGVLEDGKTYIVVNSSGSDFQLAAEGTSTALSLDTSDRSGQFQLSKAGLNLTPVAGTKPQSLIIDMTSGSGNPELLGPGDVSLRTISPPSGDGQSAASARGGGGGLGDFGDPNSSIVDTPTVTANIGAASINSGASVDVKSTAKGNVSAYAENVGGGFIESGTTHATAVYAAKDTAFIGNGPSKDATGITINADGDVFVESRTSVNLYARAKSTGGGFLAFADSHATGIVDNGGGYSGGSTATIGNNANISGRGVAVISGYDNVTFSVTTRSEAGGFTGTSDATSTDSSGLVGLSQIGTGANIEGREGLDIRVLNLNIYDPNSSVDASASFYGLSVPDETNNRNGTVSANIITGDGTTIIAAPRIPGDTNLDTTDEGAVPSHALHAEINSPRGGADIKWDADVVLQSGPSPHLVVDSFGTVQTAVNVTVDGGHGVGYLTGTTFNVDDIINDDRGQAMFKSNGSATIEKAAAGFPLFTFRDTYRNVTLTDQSSHNMVVHRIEVINKTAVTPAHEVFVRVNNDAGFAFDVTHDFKPTILTVENTDNAVGDAPYIEFAGDVDNPIGISLISNALGNIYSSGIGVVRTDTFAIVANAGSVGFDDSHRLRLEIVESNDGPTGTDRYRRIDAGTDIYIDERGLQRRALTAGETTDSGFITAIDHLKAGRDVDVVLQHGTDQTTPSSVDYQIEVDQGNSAPGTNVPGTTNVSGPTPGIVDHVRTHFRSTDEPGSVAQLFPLGVFGTGTSDTNITYVYGVASDANKRIIAGRDIDVAGPTDPSSKLVHVVAYTDILNLGNIDVLVNGDITVTEVAGDLRVGRIASMGRDVTLNSPRRILDAISGLAGDTANTGDGGVGVDADVSGRNITMTAGDNGIGGKEGQGGIGTPDNFLETNVDILHGSGATLGVLRAFDTSASSNTKGIFITEVLAGTETHSLLDALVPAVQNETVSDLEVDTIHTIGNSASLGNVTLATETGSIVDARSSDGTLAHRGIGLDTANVIGNTIDLFADGGNIGNSTGANDLEIDSQAYAYGTIGARATGSIYLSEALPTTPVGVFFARDAQVVLLQALGLTSGDGSGGSVSDGFGSNVDMRFTVRESAVLGEDLDLLGSGSVLFLEAHPETMSHGLVDTPNGSILLRVADNVNTDPNAQILAGKNVNIYGDFARVGELSSGVVENDTGDVGYGTIMHLHGVIAHGATASSYETRIFGNAEVDQVYFDQTFLGGNSGTPSSPILGGGSAQIIPDGGFHVAGTMASYSGGATRAYGSNTPTPVVTVQPTPMTFTPLAGGDTITAAPGTWAGFVAGDIITVDAGVGDPNSRSFTVMGVAGTVLTLEQHKRVRYSLETVVNGKAKNNKVAQPNSDGEDFFVVNQLQSMVINQETAAGVETGDTLTLDGQSGSDTYVINTTGTHGDVRNYVVNVLDTGATDDGVDNLSVYGRDTSDPLYTGPNGSFDDIFLLRRTTSIPNETANRPVLYADDSAFVALLDFDPTLGSSSALAQAQASDPTADATVRSQSVQRVNYDSAINGRLMVFGQGGNDLFAVDDNAATTTLDGGADNDTFQIGQLYGYQREGSGPQSATPHGNTLGGSVVTPYDQFPQLATSLTPQSIYGTVATTRGWLSAGATSPLVAEGGTGDDSFTVYSNQAPLRLEGDDGNDLFTVRAFALAETDPTSGDIVWIDPVQEIAQPKLTKGFSTAAETDIRTGAGSNQVEYNINAPVSVDGGSGFNKLVVLGTEFADHIVVTDKGIFGAGLTVTYKNIQVLEIDTLEGDDTIDVLSTAPGMAVRVIGGLGNDTINVAGDVNGDVVSRDINGTSSTINNRVTSQDEAYKNLVADGIDLSVARPNQGQVIIDENVPGDTSLGFTDVTESDTLASQDFYGVYLAHAPAPGTHVYVTVSAAMAPQEQHSNPGLLSPPSGDIIDNLGIGESILIGGSLTTAALTPANYDRDIILNGTPVHVPARAIVLEFDTSNYNKEQIVHVAAPHDGLAQGDRTVAISHTVLSDDASFDHALVRNVEVTVHDIDQSAVVVTQLDSTSLGKGAAKYGTYLVDNNTIVLEGDATTQVTDLYAIELSKAPTSARRSRSRSTRRTAGCTSPRWMVDLPRTRLCSRTSPAFIT